MSYAIVQVIYGVPVTQEVSDKIKEWEDEGDDRWSDNCGFKMLYSASGSDHIGYCGVNLCRLNSYGNQSISELVLTPTPEQIAEAIKKIEQLEPELRKLAGKPDVYLIWSDS